MSLFEAYIAAAFDASRGEPPPIPMIKSAEIFLAFSPAFKQSDVSGFSVTESKISYSIPAVSSVFCVSANAPLFFAAEPDVIIRHFLPKEEKTPAEFVTQSFAFITLAGIYEEIFIKTTPKKFKSN